MDEYTLPQEEDLLDLNEVKQAFGVSEWKNLGAVESLPGENISMHVEIEGQRYILRERQEGMVEEDGSHRYAFRQFLQRAGIPIPSLWLTPQGEPGAAIGDDNFELEQEVEGERFSTRD